MTRVPDFEGEKVSGIEFEGEESGVSSDGFGSDVGAGRAEGVSSPAGGSGTSWFSKLLWLSPEKK